MYILGCWKFITYFWQIFNAKTLHDFSDNPIFAMKIVEKIIITSIPCLPDKKKKCAQRKVANLVSLATSSMNDPELYSRASPFQIRDATQVLGAYRKNMDEPDGTDVVLDIGCGTGDVTSRILGPAIGRFEMMLGVDKSPDMVSWPTPVLFYCAFIVKV